MKYVGKIGSPNEYRILISRISINERFASCVRQGIHAIANEGGGGGGQSNLEVAVTATSALLQTGEFSPAGIIYEGVLGRILSATLPVAEAGDI